MALSIGALGSSRVGSAYTQVQSQNYSLSNQAAVSSEYVEASERLSGASVVDPSSPVVYPNAQVSTVGGVASSASVSAAFNDLANSFGGETTSYNRQMNGLSYELVGSRFDASA